MKDAYKELKSYWENRENFDSNFNDFKEVKSPSPHKNRNSRSPSPHRLSRVMSNVYDP